MRMLAVTLLQLSLLTPALAVDELKVKQELEEYRIKFEQASGDPQAMAALKKEYLAKSEAKIDNLKNKILQSYENEDPSVTQRLLYNLRKELAKVFRSDITLASSNEMLVLRSEVEPLRGVLLGMMESQNNQQRESAIMMLPYLNPDEALVEAFYDSVADENQMVVRESTNAIFALGLDTEDLRDQLVEAYSEKNPKYASLIRNNAGKWGLTEVIPITLQQLLQKYSEQNKIDRTLLAQLKEFGPQAKEVLPELQQ